MKLNNWVWTELAERKKPERKAGTKVDERMMTEGAKEYSPYQSWIEKGYVERKDRNA